MRLLLLTAVLGIWCKDLRGSLLSQYHVQIPMRDKIHLAANIFRPSGAGAVPTILIRTPYGKGTAPTPNYQAFVEHGYAVVVEDVRGRSESEGTFLPLLQEAPDGDDTLNWIAKQPWSDGKIGMLGGSYLGIAQWKVALLGNPHLKAIFPWVSGDDDYRDRFYSTGGGMKLGHRLLWLQENMRSPEITPDFRKYIWTLPLRQADVAATGHRVPLFQEALDHPDYDSFWQSLSVYQELKRLKTPVYSVGGWFDNYAESDLEVFSALQKTSGFHRILIGPWPHNIGASFPGVDFGPDSVVGLRTLQIQWFDQWLKNKDVPLMSQPPVRIFVMGTNQWRDESEWPLQRTKFTKFYLESDGHANSAAGTGTLKLELPGRSAR